MATETWYPGAVRLPITTQEFFKVRAVPTISIVEHITAGTDSRSWLQNADNGSSVHFLIRVEGGRGVVYQFMPVEWAAWGNGRHSGASNPFMPQWVKNMINSGTNINHATISVEHEGVTPTAALYTGPMLDASIALNRWLVSVVPTLKVDREHIIGHYQIDHVNRPFCPGGAGGTLFPFDAVIAAMKAGADNPLITIPTFRAFYRGEPRALQYWGLPIEPSKQEVLSDGNTYTVQYFERARFELHGTQVLLGLIGAELLRR